MRQSSDGPLRPPAGWRSFAPRCLAHRRIQKHAARASTSDPEGKTLVSSAPAPPTLLPHYTEKTGSVFRQFLE
jgi:hypothetical protein